MVNQYYQKHKERSQKEARERYKNLSEKEKDKRRKKAQEKYQNVTEKDQKKGASIIKNVKRSYLTMKEIII